MEKKKTSQGNKPVELGGSWGRLKREAKVGWEEEEEEMTQST